MRLSDWRGALTRSSTRPIVIVGAGASGTLLAIHLLRSRGPRLKITLLERQHEPGRGTAYGAAQPYHLLNVRSQNMSAYSDDPAHFVDWLKRHSPDRQGREAQRFVPRLTFGTYLAEELKAAEAESHERHEFSVIHDEAIAVERHGDTLRSMTRSGRTIEAGTVIVATGNEFRPLAKDNWARDPWAQPAVGDNGAQKPVLVHGTGLTMVDYVQALTAAGFQGPIIAISRRGLLPRPHTTTHASADVEPPPLGSLAKLINWFHRERARLEASGLDWHTAIDAVRPYSHRIWQSLPRRDQTRFLRHLRPWWDAHRHRTAPEVAERIDALIKSGRLLVIAGKIMSVEPSETKNAGALVTFRRRGHTSLSTLQVSAIADCRGVQADVVQSENPLIRALLEEDLARPHPLGLGFEIATDCALTGSTADGPKLYAIGPLTRGAFWESVAVPDIRVQCERLAAILTSGTVNSR